MQGSIYKQHMSHCNIDDYIGVCKYNDDNCPACHSAPELVEFLEDGKAYKEAKVYVELGYICISNKHRMIGRPDRNDWHVAQAEILRCAPADFYLKDGSGKLCERWREHYIRCYTTDKLTVNERIYSHLKKMGR